MSIAIDPTETTSKSRCPSIPNALPYPTLEADTGADLIISPLPIPITSALLQRHLDAGALLIQRKSGPDLPASITDGRLYHSLAKMRMLGVRQFQCVLLTTGHYWPSTKGKVDIITPIFPSGKVSKFHHPHLSYQAILSAIQGWTWRGGVYAAPLTCDDEISGWCVNTERRLKQIINQGNGRELWPMPPELYDPPELNDPLQELIPVTDWRSLFIAFRGIGQAKVNALKDSMIQHNVDYTFIDALIWMMVAPKIPGWGERMKENVMNQLGGSGVVSRLLTSGDAIEVFGISQEGVDRMNAVIAEWNTEHNKGENIK